MNNSNLKQNFIFNIIYQILIIFLPLITIPYVSRIIGPEGIGIYSYTYSIVYYFMMLSMLGINNYGNRCIAKTRDNKNKMSKTFKEIYMIQFAASLIMLVIYAIYSLFFCVEYKIVSYIQILYLFSCIFDINWFFFGLEKFKLTVTRNIIIKITSFILIFVFVKDKNDVWIYTLILSSSTFIGQILLWNFVYKYIDKVKIKDCNLKQHIVPCLKLFLPVIAVTIYKVMDKTMLGKFSNILEVGFYENAEKIICVPNAIITAFGTVLLPRMSNMYANNKYNEAKEIIKKSIKAIMFLSFAMMFGMISISNDFANLFFGSNFGKTGILIILLSITIPFLSWGNVIRTQYLIPKERDKEYIISAFIGAIINLIMNLIFIPKYGAIGACIGTICAEIFVTLYQTISIRKELPIGEYVKSVFLFFVKSIIMYFCLIIVGNLINTAIVRISVQVILGVIIYGILNIKFVFEQIKKA